MEQIINRKAAKWELSGANRALPLIRAYNSAMQDVKLIVVATYGSRPEAGLAKGALEDAGIRAMIQADTAGGMREHLAWSGAGFRILVREEDATVARDVLTPPVQGDERADADFQIDRDPQSPWRRFT
jgi:Putative prokaryotic signal transducing protein